MCSINWKKNKCFHFMLNYSKICNYTLYHFSTTIMERNIEIYHNGKQNMSTTYILINIRLGEDDLVMHGARASTCIKLGYSEYFWPAREVLSPYSISLFVHVYICLQYHIYHVHNLWNAHRNWICYSWLLCLYNRYIFHVMNCQWHEVTACWKKT